MVITDIVAGYVGNDKVVAIYLGTQQIWVEVQE